MTLSRLKSLFINVGVDHLYAKTLAENDNSKNQVYFGPGFHALNLFPNKGIKSSTGSNYSNFKASMDFSWLQPDGSICPADGAQLILYPQYPEVRFSGFLRGCINAPSDLMAKRNRGRVLFLGVTTDRRVIGYVVDHDSIIARECDKFMSHPTSGVFCQLDLPHVAKETDSREVLLAELHRINELGWINSKQLDSSGLLRPCNAPQCGGFTLEAELGIAKNSSAEPDFLGWEVKQHEVRNFDNPESGNAVTLMTPEPTGGWYKERGVEQFIRTYGYPDKKGRLDRLNFGGIHRINCRNNTTGLTLRFAGYDISSNLITDPTGCLILMDDKDIHAAEWSFTTLLSHWSHKHSLAVYVPSMKRRSPDLQYAFGHKVRLAQGTDPLHLLKALACGTAYYDPAVKLECASENPKTKRRSQFRVTSRNIGILYDLIETVEV